MSQDLLARYSTKQLILIGLVASTELFTPVSFLAVLCRAELMRRKPATLEPS